MPSKLETRFFCQECGNDYSKWQGQCSSCNAWNSLVEENVKPQKSNYNFQTDDILPQLINDIELKKDDRISSGIEELDLVLGGGIVRGSVVLFGGEPGIGKSTLMLQAANSFKENVLYVSGEESAKQIRLRAERLGALSTTLNIFPENNLFAAEKIIEKIKPQLLIIDSIQTVFRDDIPAAPGSVSQVRDCAAYLVKIAKNRHIPVFIVGHVTKEGNIAGPKILEHIVDTVLYFEGDMHKQFRILRAVKNRFGSLNETGIFEMKEKGLIPVKNPSEMLLSERPSGQSGSAVVPIIEGSRALLLEIQALTSKTYLAAPRRAVVGVDYNRASIVIAVLERRMNLGLSSQDIYLNAAGGIKAYEPAVDLAMALSIASCYLNKPIGQEIIIIGEIGLAGEIRAVSQIESRVKEAEKLGFKSAVIPNRNFKQLTKQKIKLFGVDHISEAFKACF
ncbi:MAG: DNA repair protein RadA/Sm [Candidatus Saganbacteria bacterium]|uniref:DNA repair protein RadA n=1 Tax=Candidatus Saganbacteria bacterium TaxID=2575572 RepID=A0A833KZZ8_UNCSA|nr:MAG: DNA repair protein RadA/Sm [Candidatus Saganbacteria bacterium]